MRRTVWWVDGTGILSFGGRTETDSLLERWDKSQSTWKVQGKWVRVDTRKRHRDIEIQSVVQPPRLEAPNWRIKAGTYIYWGVGYNIKIKRTVIDLIDHEAKLRVVTMCTTFDPHPHFGATVT